ncbi:MAG: hypothetical protein ACOCZ3_04615 [Bacillota bacterium]
MKTMRNGFNPDCPCIQTDCDKHGDCVACIEEHRGHQEHVPECMQPIFRGLVEKLAAKVEYEVTEGRPIPDQS